MSAPLTDTTIKESERGFLAFLSAYGVDVFDPLAALIKLIVLSPIDPAELVVDFLASCVCPDCLGDGSYVDNEHITRACPRCSGTGAVRPTLTES